MADYPVLFDGMMGTIQTTTVPELIMRTMVAPRMPADGLAARKAPLGLRRIEAALLNDGFKREDIILCAPEEMDLCIGPRTKIVAVSSSDPLGRGMSNSTMSDLAGGTLYTHTWYRRLLLHLKEKRLTNPFKVVAGGAGAWQLAQNEPARQYLGIDTVVEGYAETQAAGWFHELMDGKELPPMVSARSAREHEIPAICGPTSMGVVEISRGCGKGCQFCTIAAERMIHIPLDVVASDVERNVERGVTSICTLSEDFFRYGNTSREPVNPPVLKSLIRRLREIKPLKLIQIDHANVISVAQYSDDDLCEVHDLLVDGQRHEFLWVNLGVETASGELLDMNQKGGKIRPYKPAEWGELCDQQVRRLIKAGYFPLISLIMGLPGETPEHVEKTVRWIENLYRERLVIFP
ncbi:MAG: B12-binding domain-containing radical SAM protein, partial [Blastocatellia bacterium]|nr:B12-binding domain-containing radical SAM protein [Blastocatellia bacterium]